MSIELTEGKWAHVVSTHVRATIAVIIAQRCRYRAQERQAREHVRVHMRSVESFLAQRESNRDRCAYLSAMERAINGDMKSCRKALAELPVPGVLARFSV